jgi:hypothetical protein
VVNLLLVYARHHAVLATSASCHPTRWPVSTRIS